MNETDAINWENVYNTPDPWGIDSESYEREKIQQQISHIPHYSSVLELGCGEGSTTQLLSKKASTITSVDVSKKAIHRAVNKKYSCNVEFICGDIKTIDLEQKMYDCVLLSEVLYYLYKERDEEHMQWVENLMNHVNSSGRIIATSVLNNPTDTTADNRKRLHKRYEMHRAFKGNGFHCLSEEIGSGLKGDNQYLQYLTSVFSRHDSPVLMNPPWNNHIVPTWDDGPDHIFGSENTLQCIEDLLERNIHTFHFFWTGAHMLSANTRTSLGIQIDSSTGNSISTSHEPGSWPTSLELPEMIDPTTLQTYDLIRRKLEAAGIQLDDVIGFHGITHPHYDHSSHLHFQSAETIASEILLFQEMCRKAFAKPNLVIRHGRPPHGAGFPLQEGRPDHLQEFMRASQFLPQDFQWKLWRTSSKDWRRAEWDPSSLAKEAWQTALSPPEHSWETAENPILFHSRYYSETRSAFLQFLDCLNG